MIDNNDIESIKITGFKYVSTSFNNDIFNPQYREDTNIRKQ